MSKNCATSPATGGWDWEVLRRVAYAQAASVLGPGPDAEDAAQAALMRAWVHRAACREQTHPDPWIGRIARREALRIHTARRRGTSPYWTEESAVDGHDQLLTALDVTEACAGLSRR